MFSDERELHPYLLLWCCKNSGELKEGVRERGEEFNQI